MKTLAAPRRMSSAFGRARSHVPAVPDKWLPFLFLVPSIIALAAIMAYPLGYSFWLSLYRYNLISPRRYVGLQNYRRIWQDEQVWNSLKVTFEFAIPVLTLNLVLGFGLALLIHHKARAKAFWRIIFSLPILLTPVVIGLNWRVLLNYDFGVVNYYLTKVGIDRQLWVNDARMAMPTLILVDAWQTTSFVILVLVAGLAALPEDLFEAAKVDGASIWQQIWSLTIPLLKPLFLVIIFFLSFELLRVFDIVWTLTRGGPGRATETISFHIYSRTFQSYALGYGAAMSYVLFIVSATISIILIKLIGTGSAQQAEEGKP
jgi:multiple sugar transport system permease protein